MKNAIFDAKFEFFLSKSQKFGPKFSKSKFLTKFRWKIDETEKYSIQQDCYNQAWFDTMMSFWVG